MTHRNQVAEALRVGEKIPVVLTDETHGGELLIAPDTTDVINRPPGDGTPEGQPPREESPDSLP